MLLLQVMTDGDDSSGSKDEQVLAKLPTGEDPSDIHIYSIAYGSQLNAGTTVSFFKDITSRTNGATFDAIRLNMTDVWNEISIQF